MFWCEQENDKKSALEKLQHNPRPNQNSQKNGNDPQPQPPPENEDDNDENIPAEAKESVERNRTPDEREVSDNNRASTSAPQQISFINDINVITSEKDIRRVTLPNKAIEGTDENSGEHLSSEGIERLRARLSRKTSSRPRRMSWKSFFDNPKNFSVVFSYAVSNQQRQPFRPQPRTTRLPEPPSYYSTLMQNQSRRDNTQRDRGRPQRSTPSQPQSRLQPQSQQPEPPPESLSPQRPNPPPREYHYDVRRYVPLSQLGMFPFVLTQAGQWIAYPSRVPDGVPPTLAQLYEAEVFFVIQQLDIIELMTDIVEPNTYLVLNKNGECIYYVYETSDVFAQCCAGHTRSLQLHIADMYQNDVIFMNKHCGCTYLFCCYPVIEVYSPPTVPLGAVAKQCNGFRSSLVIIDTDENVMFTIQGENLSPSSTYGVDFSIRALDSNRTQVGFIRKEFIFNAYAMFSSFDYYGLSFPGNMDVRVKALFLGALFLIDYMYYEGGGCCQC